MRYFPRCFFPLGLFIGFGLALLAFQAVEQTGNVGVARNHTIPDFAARQALGSTPQDPQHVVLRGRKILRVRLFPLPQKILTRDLLLHLKR